MAAGRRWVRGRSVSAVAVVVVGAGIAGIACARGLALAGVAVRVVERARVVGGRMASRHLHGRPVDLGAAYFTVSDPEFARVVEGWHAAGLARPWTDTLAVFANGTREAAPGPMRWAAPGGLRSLVAALATGLDVTLQHEVRCVGPGPRVDGEHVDAVVLAMPDPQAPASRPRPRRPGRPPVEPGDRRGRGLARAHVGAVPGRVRQRPSGARPRRRRR